MLVLAAAFVVLCVPVALGDETTPTVIEGAVDATITALPPVTLSTATVDAIAAAVSAASDATVSVAGTLPVDVVSVGSFGCLDLQVLLGGLVFLGGALIGRSLSARPRRSSH